MNYNNPQQRSAVLWCYVLYSLLFCAFCYIFLWKVQGGMLGMAQHILSHGQTIYFPPVGALVLTVVLWLLQLLLNTIVRLRGEWYAFSFFPSFVFLTALTYADSTLYTGASIVPVKVGVPMVLVLYFLLAFILRGTAPFTSQRGYGWEVRLLLPNAVIMMLSCILTCSFSYTEKELHNQVEIEYAIANGDYRKALTVGKYSPRANQATTALRAVAMAKEGVLGDKLFNYPQEYGAEGLLLNRADSLRMLYAPDSLYFMLGAYPSARTTTALMFLQWLDKSEAQRKPLAKDYLLAALLLERKLPEFVEELNLIQEISDSIDYPRYYQEALVLYRHRFRPELPYHNVIQETNYEDYQSAMRQGEDDHQSKNLAGEDFGTTYWWYYDFGNKKNEE